jgi:hypothetical protein
MVKGQKRTIDPKKVTSLERWVHYYKSYGNIVEGPDNTFLVLDPASLDESAPVKTFAIGKAVDAVTALHLENDNRAAQAAALLQDAATKRATAVAAANDAYRAKEQQLLREVQHWKTAGEPAVRSLMADTIGILQKELSELDTARREARYPHRYILEEKRLPRMVLNYATRDERVIQNAIYRTVPQTMTISERIIEVGKA